MSPVAAIDIGTNSVLLLVAEDRGGEIVPVLERATITRLGRGVDATRTLSPEGVDATLACLADYSAEIARAGASRVAAVGTSAMRDARGGGDFIARAQSILGVAPRVISGNEEAELTFAGALSGLSVEGSVIVFDLGGGSTEIIRGRVSRGAPPVIERAVSLDIGSVRLTERHVRADPPSASEIDAVRGDARGALASLGEGWTGGARLVGVAGTVTTIAAFARDVAPYDGARVHGAALARAEVSGAVARLAAMPFAERRSQPTIDPRRADVIPTGGLIVEEILAWAGTDDLVASDRGVRWGLAARLAHESSEGRRTSA